MNLYVLILVKKVIEQSYVTKYHNWQVVMLKNNSTNEIQGAVPRTIRDYNRRMVLRSARERDVFSISEIAADVMMSRQSVIKALSYFIKKGIIVSVGKGNSTETGGKKPKMYALRPPHRYIVILHRTDELIFQLMDMFYNRLDGLSITVTKSLTGEEFVKALKDGSNKLLIRNPGAKEALYGVALAMGGLVEQTNHSLHRSMYYSNIPVGFPIYDILREIFPDTPRLIVDNIGRMAGQSVLLNTEITHGWNRVFTIYIDRAITGCFFVDGKIQSDSALMMIEVGHMVLDLYDDEKCTCGNYGCAESLISIKKVRRSIAEKKGKYEDSCLARIPTEQITFDDLFAGCNRGDALCIDETKRLASTLGHLLRNIFLVCDPGLVVFMGNFSHAGDVFDSTLKEAIRNGSLYTVCYRPFDIAYDHRDLATLELLGCALSVVKSFYDDDNLYNGDKETLICPQL
jgi:N-acetylglucosamine repressor